VVGFVAGFAWVLSGRWHEVLASVRDQRPEVVAASFGLCLGGVFLSFLLWRGVLAGLGSPVPIAPAARIFFIAQLGKYLPGSLWPVLAQMKFGQQAGIPRQRMGLAFALTLALSVAWGLLIGLLAVPALLFGGAQTSTRSAWPWLLVLLVPMVLALMAPRVLNALLSGALRMLRRPGLDQPLTGRQVGMASVLTVAFWLVFALHAWVLVVGLGARPLYALPVAVGGFALAFSIGPLLVVLPAGAGVREAALVVMLLPVLEVPQATAVALTSRGLLMLTDGVLALAAAPLGRRSEA
jgi:hypothetical protein